MSSGTPISRLFLATVVCGSVVAARTAQARVMVQPKAGAARAISDADVKKAKSKLKSDQQVELLRLMTLPVGPGSVDVGIPEADIGDYLAIDADFLIKRRLPKFKKIGEFLEQQKVLESHMRAAPEAYAGRAITVGLELEFLPMTDRVTRPASGEACGNNLHGLLHVEVTKSKQISFGLPIFLETDAGDELEMVMPPAMVPVAVADVPLPLMTEVNKVRERLSGILTPLNTKWADPGSSGKCGKAGQQPCTIAGLKAYLTESQGIQWADDEPEVAVAAKNLYGTDAVRTPTIPMAKVLNTCVVKGDKSGGAIYEQLNVAVDWKTYVALKSLVRRVYTPFETSGGARYVAVANRGFLGLKKKNLYLRLQAEPAAVRAAVVELIETAASGIATPGVKAVLDAYTKVFNGDKATPLLSATISLTDTLTSGVKEWRFVWRKTSLRNFLTAALRPGGAPLLEATTTRINEYVAAALPEMNAAVATAYDTVSPSTKELTAEVRVALQKDSVALLDGYPAMISALLTTIRTTDVSFPHVKVQLRHHDDTLISPRQDTYIPMENVRKSLPVWPGRDLFVVELRGGAAVVDQVDVIAQDLLNTADNPDANAYLEDKAMYVPFVGYGDADTWYDPTDVDD